MRVFLPAPFLLKRRKRKKLGGRKLHCSGIRRGLFCFPFFSSDSPLSLFCLFRVLFVLSFPSVLLSFYIFSADFVPRLPFILARGTRGGGATRHRRTLLGFLSLRGRCPFWPYAIQFRPLSSLSFSVVASGQKMALDDAASHPVLQSQHSP